MKKIYKLKYHPLYDKFILNLIYSGCIFHDIYKDFYYADKKKLIKYINH